MTKRRIKCPTCGQSKSDLKQNFSCHLCGHIVKEVIHEHATTGSNDVVDEWESHPSGNMDYKEFAGITN